MQENAKKQLQEAQAEQSRLVARASSLNQELSVGKMLGVNIKQLNQRLRAVSQIYGTQNQVLKFVYFTFVTIVVKNSFVTDNFCCHTD